MLIPPTLSPGWVRVQSSNLRAVYYDAPFRHLEIEFHGGRIYSYEKVPAGVHRGLMASASKGRYFHANIRSRYPYRRLR